MANERSIAVLALAGMPEGNFDLVAAIIDTLPVLAWTAKPDGSVDYLNRQWLAFTGLPAEEAHDWNWLQATHPADRERVSAVWRDAMASGEPAEAELRLRRADGNYLWFLARAVALRDDTGRVLKWYGTSTDIQERKQAESALRASEHDFRQIADSVPGLIFTTAPDGAVEFVNKPLLDYFGVGLDVLRHWQQTDHVHPDDLPRVIEAATRGFASRQPFGYEERLRRNDGVYRRFRLRATPMVGSAGEVVRWYGVLSDVEEQRAAEAELALARERLSRAMQLAAVSELAASVAQGVVRPLQGISEAGEACRRALMAQPLDVAGVLVHADGIVRDASAAADVVRHIRDLFRQQPGARELLNLNGIVAQVLDSLADEVRASQAVLSVALRQDLPAVLADPMQMQQVCLHLACSALAATGSAERTERSLRVASDFEAGEVVVRVTARGGELVRAAAVPPSTLSETAADDLRLSMCRSIVHGHGGRLWVTHDAPRTLSFCFALPAADLQHGENG